MNYNVILENYINDCPFNEPIFIDKIFSTLKTLKELFSKYDF